MNLNSLMQVPNCTNKLRHLHNYFNVGYQQTAEII